MYTLRFPFELSEGHSINGLENPLITNKDELQISLEFHKPYYVLLVKGFKSIEVADDFMNNTIMGLNYAMISSSFGFKYDPNLDSVFYYPNPEIAAKNYLEKYGIDKGDKLDCNINGNSPCVYPTTSVKIITTGYGATFTHGLNSNTLLSNFLKGINYTVNDDKLKLALEIFNGHCFEQSNQAKFLSLVIVLESLSPKDIKKHKIVQERIDLWEQELNTEKENFEIDSNEYEALEDLIKELNFKREASLNSRIQTLVYETLKKDNPKAKELAKKAKQIYNFRSRLVHSGKIDVDKLSQALTDVREIVLLILKAKINDLNK